MVSDLIFLDFIEERKTAPPRIARPRLMAIPGDDDLRRRDPTPLNLDRRGNVRQGGLSQNSPKKDQNQGMIWRCS